MSSYFSFKTYIMYLPGHELAIQYFFILFYIFYHRVKCEMWQMADKLLSLFLRMKQITYIYSTDICQVFPW